MGPASLFLLLLLLSNAAAQSPPPAKSRPKDGSASYRPWLAIVIVIFTVMFSVTLILLLTCARIRYHTTHTGLLEDGSWNDLEGLYDGPRPPGLQPLPPRSSGVDKKLIESLPFFRFSSLNGSREGMECVVCLSRFEAAELLRLLPKCKHAFHIDCVDRWLEDHSSCPLCRCPVLPEDLNLFKYSTSSRLLLRDPAVPAGETDLALYVEREPGEEASRAGWIETSFRKMGRVLVGKESQLIAGGGQDEGRHRGGREMQEQLFYHRFKHRIIVSDIVFKNRWSDLNSSDLVSLNTERLRSLSSRHFPVSAMDVVGSVNSGENSKSFLRRNLSSHAWADDTIRTIKEEMKKKRSLESKANVNSNAVFSTSGENSSGSASLPKFLDPSANNRAVSEIVNISRFADTVDRSSRGEFGTRDGSSASKEEKRVREVWLPIARRTVQWSTAREEIGRRCDGDG